MADLEAAERGLRAYMAAVGLDVDDPTLVDTPRRVAEVALELYAGVGKDAVAVLGAGEPIEGVYPGPVVVRRIPYSSVCEHHLLPFRGTVSVAYLPDRKLAGIGDFDTVLRVLAARPQMQERLTDQIADAVWRALDPKGVLVHLEAEQSCMWARGERTVGAIADTYASRGVYDSGPERAEALAFISR